MRSLWTSIDVRGSRFAAAAVFLASCWLTTPMVAAQEGGPLPIAPPVSSAPTESTPAFPPPKPEVFETIGRWVDEGTSTFQDHLRGATQRVDELSDMTTAAKVGQGAVDVTKGAVDVTKDAVGATASAVGAVAKLPTARLMSGRERCAVAPNGAPDCVTAAEALCRKHGFNSGKSMDFTSAEECPASTLLGQTSRDECTTVTFISRAMCQ
jgi:hypothetical protein